ncbi:MAG: hypothetical protein NZ959_04760 [Armatimonadetes bacterium]|nr:hypothetical protein [Armatimonadota bacterium]MDW8120884.1 hypothetical protein [Armatimonadota bacterium]
MRSVRNVALVGSSLLTVLLTVKLGVATPSTAYWTPCTIDLQAPGVWHLTYDTYFPIRKPNQAAFPIIVGLTYGFRLDRKLQMEAGFDWLESSRYPLLLNAKIGYPEGALGPESPALQIGFFNWGTKSGVTNQNCIQLVTGKTFKGLGRVHFSYYIGNRTALGGRGRSGFMIAWDRWLVPGKYLLVADYATGKNAIGGGGVGLSIFFTENINLLTGPVWFNDGVINGKWKWTFQIDINF